jgi:acetoin utilization protein AcuB
MFSVYGVRGQVFRGTLENLGQIPEVLGSRAARAFARGEKIGTPVQNAPPNDAIDAYQGMLRVDQERGPLYYAFQIMHRLVVSVAADDDLLHAWRILLDNDIQQAPVLDSARHLVGIISERNLLGTLDLAPEQMPDAVNRKVREVMTSPVVSADPGTDIRRIAQVMLAHKVGGVPIVDAGEALVGFVSHSDILRAIVIDPPLSLWR